MGQKVADRVGYVTRLQYGTLRMIGGVNLEIEWGWGYLARDDVLQVAARTSGVTVPMVVVVRV